MDHLLTARIYSFLQLDNPTDEQIIEGATMLLKCNPNRERGIYNTALRRPRATLPWIRTDLKKYYDIRQRGLTTSEVEQFNSETVSLVEQTLSQVPSTIEQDCEECPIIPVLGVRGQREDHEELPEDIKAIWERNAERWKKMRAIHALLSQMIARPDYSPCDGNELCYALRQTDTELRNDYQIYDTFVVTPAAPEMPAHTPVDHVDTFVDNVKTIQNARTAISRGLTRKSPHTEESLKKMQDAVNTLFSLNQTIKAETVGRLEALGIVVPNTNPNAEG